MFAFQMSVPQPPPAPAPKEVKMELPDDTVRTFPAVMVENKAHESVPLGMNALKTDIQVVGNIAVTTLDMTFFNNEDRVLQGELYFPLAAGQTVSRFAMEVDGKLREGVVVEKKEARVAYESTVRQKVDPGLLEWTKGNNFKARVYPIPANGFKRIVVSYTQELQEINGQLQYYMPMNFKDTLKEFDVKIEVLKQEIRPVLMENELHCFRFDRWNENYKAEMNLQNVLANQPLFFGIPFPAMQNTMIEKGSDGLTYFYTTVHPQKGSRTKQLPKALSLVWDVSGSAKNRNLERELELLKTYLSKIGNATVELVTFSNEVHSRETIAITGGNSEPLIAKLRAQNYDGATQLGSIDLKQLNGEEIILSSDCLGNFGSKEIQKGSKPIYVWNSSATSDHSNAQYIADKTRGQYVNLNELTTAQALDKMTHQQLRFLGVTDNADIEVTTDRANSFTESFSLAGTVKTTARMAMQFGYDNEITETIYVDLHPSMAADFGGLTAKIWAQKRIAELDLRYDMFKDEITRLGKKYSIVTRNTSLLVLDRIEDYVQHRIIPPADMRKKYNELVSREEKDKAGEERSHMEGVVAAFNERKSWWNTKFTPPPVYKEQKQKEMSGAGRGNAVGAVGSSASEELVMDMEVATAPSSATYSFSSVSPLANALTGERECREKAKGSVELANWDPKTPYLAKLKSVDKTLWYTTYLSLKKEYEKQPSFFIDVADFFIRNKENKTALRILSNIAEMELENPQLLRILGHRLEQLNYYDLSISVFKEVKEMRPEEPQSYRDLGLVYALNHQEQQAVDELYYLVSHAWDGRFSNIESLAAVEMNEIIANASKPVDVSAIDPRLLYAMPVDMRVVINWDTDACDIDLWVTDPRGEKCYYSNKLTAAGGRISDDFTGGYGPEEFIIKKAIPGNYTIEANYFGNSSQSITGATTIQVQMTTNYGRKTAKTKEITRRLETNKEVLKLGTFAFKPN